MAYPGGSSSSGSLIPPCTYDVFLSFRGKDTRTSFTYNLYKALEREKIKTFFDDRKLKRGDYIPEALPQAIELSKISVVICSKNYGSSSWCLDELVKILECQKSKQQIVIPLFYKVNPADVRRQIGNFGQAFTGHGSKNSKYKNKDKIPIWKAALTQVANLSGWTYVGGYEADFIETIVKEILKCLDDQKKKEDVAGNNHHGNSKASSGLNDQKKNITGADLYNRAVLEVQKTIDGADLNNQSLLKVQTTGNGEDLYNQAFFQFQKTRHR